MRRESLLGEEVWVARGHNGGDLHFGNDGYLYISTGDATSPNPPDRLDTGQDISDLPSSILRIDVDCFFAVIGGVSQLILHAKCPAIANPLLFTMSRL